ncbi:Aminopeptidase N [Liparis tanakae]|uniref:Aminopeptidase n=1 Tax=Liparis tanakae TaxID=230148 RepID=A0A4Z2HYU9_9TELE|nr:Aminopeptidase N [Liparis tanakae]
MGKGLFLSKVVAAACVVAAIGAAATIIALSVVYAQEKSKNEMTPQSTANPTISPTISPTTTTGPTTPSTPKEPWQRYRLPKSLAPVSYNVTLWPRLERNADNLFVFTGHSTVVFRCVTETDLLLIHSNKLNLTSFDGYLVKLRGLNGEAAPGLKATWLVKPTQYLVVQLHSPLQAGSTYELFTEFVGELADDLGGFYRSEYVEDGVTKVVATTQMQPTDARKAFPCFDEPAMKAVFHMTLIHPHGTVALSNSMNYGKFFSHIRIWARKKAIEEGQGAYALEKTGSILAFFENYYNSSYPLTKSDQIALPDFSAGAMENWGLITYRETALLYNPAVSSNGDKEWVATVISHELAHMWFGNLVTTRWWNDLWLNEGFATYVSYLGADFAEPKWNMKDLIVQNEIIGVMSVDALASSHPLSSKEEDVLTPEHISELFDSITYSKAVEKADITLPHSIEVIMNRWILQMGFPVVTINTQTGEINQKHFLLDPESVVDRPSEFNDWLVANIDTKGFYRVNYDSDNWERLLAKLSSRHVDIPVINRAQLIDDAFNLARAKMVDTTLALRTTKFLDKEVEYMPWETARRNLNYFYLMFDRSEVYGPMQAYVNKQVTPLFNHFQNITGNWTNIPENHTDQYNQVNAISMACSTGVKGCEQLTTGWFKEWQDNPHINKISPNLRYTVYCSAIAAGGVKEWDFAWSMFKNATIATEADKLMSALSCTKQPWLLNRYLDYCLMPGNIRKQDATSTIISIAGNPIGQPLAWAFVRAKWDYIFNNYGGGSFSFGGLISGLTRRFSSEFEYQQLLQFKEDNAGQLGSATTSLEQALERTKANMKWVAVNKQQVFDWFKSEAPTN